MTEPTQSESTEYVPKQSLRLFVQALLSREVKGNKEEAQRVTGVYKGTFYWHLRHNVEFRLWFEAQCDRALMAIRATVDNSLLKEIKDGNVPAMRTYYEVIGKIKNKVTQAVNIDARDTKMEVNVYPQFDINFADVIPENADELTTGDGDPATATVVHAVESSEGTVKRLPL